MQQAENDLLKAQALNPLNTDHTANLARLYSYWAAYATTPEERQQRAEKSSQYFSRAVALSRNSALLWDEWASLYLFVLQQPEEAYARLETRNKSTRISSHLCVIGRILPAKSDGR